MSLSNNSSGASNLHQRILDFEARFRRLNILESSKKKEKPGCMTSPLPRRPMPLIVSSREVGLGTIAFDGPPIRTRVVPADWEHIQANRQSDSAENERRLTEIMNNTGCLTLNGVQHRVKLDDLELVGDLGQGTCGHVVKMRYKVTGHLMAVKQMRRTGNKEENKRVLMDLDVVLRSHDCPYIVQCYGCFITDSEVWICMELMATCLDKLKRKLKRGISEDVLGKMAVSILKALNYLKEHQGIIHRDVKPSNMLVDWNGTIKLCDFGISGRLVDSKAKTRNAGCAAYMAPERIEPPDPSRPDYDIRADVWSMGISLVELATGKFPYEGCHTDFEVLAKVLDEDPPILTPDMGFTPMFCSYVRDCLTKNYHQRPKYKKLLVHPFIKHYENAQVDVATWFAKAMEQSPQSLANNNVLLTRH